MKKQPERTTIHDPGYLSPTVTCFVPVAKCQVELFATIKCSSKYYYQGLDKNKNPRCRDLSFWVKGVEGDLIALAGGMKS